MGLEKMQHCFNCGAELGIYRSYYGEIETCEQPECQREMRNWYADKEASAREAAEDDDYSRYKR